MLNYKEIVSFIFVNEKAASDWNTDGCECEHSQFCDPNNRHIMIGDLFITGNSKSGKLITNGPNYTKPRISNVKAFNIKSVIDKYIQDFSKKDKTSRGII